MNKVIPLSSLNVLLILIILAVSLTGMNVDFEVLGINSSFLEVFAAIICLSVLINGHSKTSPLWIPYLFLLLCSAIPILIGLFDNNITRVFRDSAQLTYVSFIFLGHYFYSRQLIKPDTLIRVACWISVVGSSFFLLNSYIIESSYISTLEYNWRVLIAFSAICLYVKLLGILRRVKISSFTVLFMLATMIIFLVQIRTRAFLLMVAIGFIIVTLSFLYKKKSSYEMKKFLSFGISVPILLVVAMSLGGLDLIFTNEGSLSRLLEFGESEQQDVTALYRLEAWSQALNGFIESPFFGQGFGSYMLLDPWINGKLQFYPSAMIHNGFLQMLYVGGIANFLGYTFLFYGIYRSAGFEVAQYHSENESVGVRILTRSFLISYLIYASFGTSLFAVNESIIFWFLVGYFSQKKKKTKGRHAFRRFDITEKSA